MTPLKKQKKIKKRKITWRWNRTRKRKDFSNDMRGFLGIVTSFHFILLSLNSFRIRTKKVTWGDFDRRRNRKPQAAREVAVKFFDPRVSQLHWKAEVVSSRPRFTFSHDNRCGHKAGEACCVNDFEELDFLQVLQIWRRRILLDSTNTIVNAVHNVWHKRNFAFSFRTTGNPDDVVFQCFVKTVTTPVSKLRRIQDGWIPPRPFEILTLVWVIRPFPNTLTNSRWVDRNLFAFIFNALNSPLFQKTNLMWFGRLFRHFFSNLHYNNQKIRMKKIVINKEYI